MTRKFKLLTSMWVQIKGHVQREDISVVPAEAEALSDYSGAPSCHSVSQREKALAYKLRPIEGDSRRSFSLEKTAEVDAIRHVINRWLTREKKSIVSGKTQLDIDIVMPGLVGVLDEQALITPSITLSAEEAAFIIGGLKEIENILQRKTKDLEEKVIGYNQSKDIFDQGYNDILENIKKRPKNAEKFNSSSKKKKLINIRVKYQKLDVI